MPAGFAVPSESDDRVEVEIVRVPYPAEDVAEGMRSVGPPDELAEKLVAAN